MALALATVLIILGFRRYLPNWPGLLIAVGAASAGAALLGLPVETIGTRFGGIPNILPLPTLPTITYDRVVEMLPSALSFALLSAASIVCRAIRMKTAGARERPS